MKMRSFASCLVRRHRDGTQRPPSNEPFDLPSTTASSPLQQIPVAPPTSDSNSSQSSAAAQAPSSDDTSIEKKPHDPTSKQMPDTHISDASVAAYIERQLKPQRDWYSHKAVGYKKIFYRLVGVQVAATSVVPVLNMLSIQHRLFTYLSTIATVMAALSAGWLALGKYKEHWLRYRNTAEQLKNLEIEYDFFLAPFNGGDRNKTFIDIVQKTLSDERTSWQADVKSSSSSQPGMINQSSLMKNLPPHGLADDTPSWP